MLRLRRSMIVLGLWAVSLSVHVVAAAAAAPGIAITSGPSGPTASMTAAFGFVVDLPAARIAGVVCRLDRSVAPCNLLAVKRGRAAYDGHVTFSGLAEGAHTFSVAVALKGGGGSAVASRDWVVDLTPPVLHDVPDDVQVPAVAADHASVSYSTPTATDNLDSAPVVACSPASGTNFSLGTTTVRCTATDAAGNASSATFSVLVYAAVAISASGGGTVAGAGELTGVSLTVPPGAFPSGAIVGFVPVENPDSDAPSGSVGPSFEIASTAEPSAPLTLRVPFDPNAEGAADGIQLGWWSKAGSQWRTVPTDFDPSHDILVARILHFSVWTWIKKQVTGISASKPVCEGSPPTWAHVNQTASGEYGIATSCAGSTSDGLLQVRVQSAHAGASYVRFDQQPDRLTLAGVHITARQDAGTWYTVVPDGAVLEADFARPTTKFVANEDIYAYAGEDGITYLYDALVKATGTLIPSLSAASDVAAMFLDCYPQLTDAVSTRSASDILTAVECLDTSLLSQSLDLTTKTLLSSALDSSFKKVSLWLDAATAARDFLEAAFAAGAAPAVIDATVTTLGQVTPSLQLTPTSGQSGSSFGVTGSGFHPDESIGITWSFDATTGLQVATAETDANGTFSVGSVAIPALSTVGSHTVTATGAISNDSASEIFMVTSNAGPGPVYEFAQTLTAGSDAASGDSFGSNPQELAISTDGSTVLIGSCLLGEAFVFEREASGWTQTARLDPEPNISPFSGNRVACTVALSGDGNTAAITDLNTVDIYDRTSSGWQQEQAKLFDPKAFQGITEGYGVYMSFSHDGTSLLVSAGGSGSTVPPGADLWIRGGSSWSVNTSFISSSHNQAVNGSEEVALSDDGSTALVGGSSATQDGPDALDVYKLTNGVWNHTGTITDPSYAFISFSVDAAGVTISVLAQTRDSSGQVVDIYTYSPSGWIVDQELQRPDVYTYFSGGSTLSGDGTIFLVGTAPGLLVSERTSVWSPFADVNPSLDNVLCRAVAISGDGSTILASATDTGLSAPPGSVLIYTAH